MILCASVPLWLSLAHASPLLPSQATEALDRGVQHLAEGRIEEALATFHAFRQANPTDARSYFYAGMALAEAGRWSSAALELEEAVRLDPTQLHYRVFQGNLYARLKQNLHAERTLAPFQNPQNLQRLATAWLRLLAEVYFRLEKTAQALQVLQLWGQRSPWEPHADLLRGKVHTARGEFDSAVQSLKASIGKSPRNPVAHFELGKILHQRSELEASRDALREAVRQDPSDPEYLHRLAVVLLDLGEFAEAIGLLERARSLDPVMAEVCYALARAYQRKGDRARAMEYRKQFQELSVREREKESREQEVSKLIAQAEGKLDQGNPKAARALFEQAVRQDPLNWDAHAYLAEMFVNAGEWRLAHSHLIKMEQIDSDSVVGAYLMARYWYYRQEFEKARLYAEKVKRARPAHAELLNLLGNIYVGLKQYEKARQEYQAAVALAPDRSDFKANLENVEKHLLKEKEF